MPGKPKIFKARHGGPARRSADVDRGSARQRGYDSHWEAARRAHLFANPLCLGCLAEGRSVAAVMVDHVIPHRGDRVLFWRRELWQSACGFHGNAVKQVLERKWDAREISDAALWLNSREACAVAAELSGWA